jgi:Protein of unknown function (DUF2950)
MHTTHTRIEGARRRSLARLLAPAVVALLMASHAQTSSAQTSRPKTFASAGEASEALFQAVRSHDEPTIEAILGAGKEITSTGDDDGDTLERERFCQKYQEMHRLVREPDGTTVVYIGAENWPFPFPLTARDGRWSFNAQTGRQEILFRRIGENEAMALDVARELVAARQSTPPDNRPYHGYYFRRVAGGHGIAAVTLVAYPAEYRSSGVMTFLVTANGRLYEKDLGPNTSTLASAITAHKPASGWHLVRPSDDAGPSPSGSR